MSTEWQPIETAPRGGGEFLGWDASLELMDKTWEGWEDDGVPAYLRSDWVQWYPTHWMPLPTPPKTQE